MKRTEVENQYKIDLGVLYKSQVEFASDCQLVSKGIAKIQNYKGKVTSSAKVLYEVLELVIDVSLVFEKLSVYTTLTTQIDASDKAGKNAYAKVNNLATTFASEIAFVDDELLKCEWNTIKKYLKENEDLQLYEFYLRELFKDKEHILSEKEEILLSHMSSLADTIENNRSIFFYEDLEFGKVGKTVITNQNYNKLLESKDRNFRRNVFKTYNKTFAKFGNTFAALLNSKLTYDIDKAKIRGFSSVLDMSLNKYNLDKKVIDNYLQVAQENRALYKNYNKLLKDVLGYKSLYSYDLRYNPLKKSDKTYSVEEAKDIILSALSIYGEQYNKYLIEIFNGKVDYLPTDNKATGAFCIQAYKTRSFAFLNYQGKMIDISTLTHELGHAVHSLFLIDNNKPVYASSSFLLVEIASLTNEILLCEHILKTSVDAKEKYELLKTLLDTLLANFFLVAGRLEVQNKMYEMIEKGDALTADFIGDINYESMGKYDGNGLNLLPQNKYIWMRVSHYYSLYYNYQYAIGVAIACLFATKILTGEEKEINNYLEFLKSSGRDYPTETLKKYGVDLTKKDVFTPLINYIESKLKDLKETIKELK